MTIQINTDKHIEWEERHNEYTRSVIHEELERFSEHITRVEMHLSDENGAKSGPNDIRCLIEVRVEGHQPMVTSDNADSTEEATKGALAKMKSSLNKLYKRTF